MICTFCTVGPSVAGIPMEACTLHRLLSVTDSKKIPDGSPATETPVPTISLLAFFHSSWYGGVPPQAEADAFPFGSPQRAGSMLSNRIVRGAGSEIVWLVVAIQPFASRTVAR